FLIGLRAWRTCTAGTLYGSIRRRFRARVCGCGAEPLPAGSDQENPQGIVPAWDSNNCMFLIGLRA
ncbi:hypothetical protein, partial [Sphingobacterium mizutaii]|uniref:hypothetical protein n=1 Tax=Sphingobacterium mizutaii TaxID=1010 RepID=UPI001BE3D951